MESLSPDPAWVYNWERYVLNKNVDLFQGNFWNFFWKAVVKSHHTWLSNPEKESLHSDPGYISLESLGQGIFIKCIEADYLIFGRREPSDMIFHILSIETPYEAFNPCLLLSRFLLQDWEERGTKKEKQIASKGNY